MDQHGPLRLQADFTQQPLHGTDADLRAIVSRARWHSPLGQATIQSPRPPPSNACIKYCASTLPLQGISSPTRGPRRVSIDAATSPPGGCSSHRHIRARPDIQAATWNCPTEESHFQGRPGKRTRLTPITYPRSGLHPQRPKNPLYPKDYIVNRKIGNTYHYQSEEQKAHLARGTGWAFLIEVGRNAFLDDARSKRNVVRFRGPTSLPPNP